LSEKVMLVLLAVEAGAVKEGSRFLPSRRVPSKACAIQGVYHQACAIKGVCHQSCDHPRRVRDLAIKAGVVEVDFGSCSQVGCWFLKQIKGIATSLRV